MAEYTIVQVKRDSTLNWYASNPRLALGEPGVDMDLHRFKIGNGIDRWNELPYMDDDLYKLLDEQQQATADYVQDLLNRIAANKLDADQKYNALTSEVRNTSRDLTGRMTAVETGQQEYQENLTERQQEFEEAVTGDFEDTKAEVQAGLDEFNETRDSLTVRMNAIAGQATEDTEILDARVDAESYTHPNLGENIRNVHRLLKEAVQTSAETKAGHDAEIAGLKAADEAESTARAEADETEKAERIAAVEAEKAERLAGHEEHGAELLRLDDSAEKLDVRDEFLQEQINANAEGLFATQRVLAGEIERSRKESVRLDEETEARIQKDTELDDALAREKEARMQSDVVQDERYQEFLQEQQQRLDEDTRLEGELSEVDRVHTEREEELAGDIQENTASTREKLSVHADFLQEQTDEISGLVMSEMLQNREKFRAVQDDIQLEARERSKLDAQIRESVADVDETHSLNEAEIRRDTEEGLHSARGKISVAAEHLQEQADILASELQQAGIANWKKVRELEAEDKGLHEEIRDAEQRLRTETTETAAAIRREMQDDVSVLGRTLTRRDEHIQEQANQNAQSALQMASNLLQETKRRNRDIQSVREEIGSETLERIRDTDSVRDEHRTDIRRLDDADSVAAKIRHNEDSGLQEQINELAALKLNEALTRYRENLQAKTDKQHENAVRQEISQKYNDQIIDLVEAVLHCLFIGYRAREKIKARIQGLEYALTEVGILDDSYIPPVTDTEIEGMLEDIFSGNTSGGTIEPDDEDEAEFLEDIYNIFNP